MFHVGAKEHLQTDFLDRDWLDCLIGKTMGKECMARLSRRLWGGTNLKTAAKEATIKGLGHAILGNFSTDRMVVELTKISK